ncbi:hypothetical protein ASE74_02600 [Pedobacter sp. Leaf216]|uniref:hypothetical protein n=1 Tax=Pedobacter sp. Leaf216 TaxID=1735684 RepID=UPI0006F39A7A|nr:hypothetical protein [Pedobacter sp. Leaf216]KQM74890.1 hypothetical protein ASE74_02600 [Pedobacter sp. Leaf216]
MLKKVITLCYRKIIDTTNTSAWDKFVHEDSFAEFKMQAQFYNQEQRFTTFAEMLINTPEAEKLHFLVSAAITGYLRQLNGIIPDIMDNLGRRFLTFENFKFELINSDINDLEKHKIAINFFSKPLLWHDTVDNLLLVSQFKEANEAEVFTNLFQIQPFVSIHAIKHTY